MKQGIIFDVDGTLWDSSRQVAESWNVVLKEQYPHIKKEVTLQDMYDNMGKAMDEFARDLFPDLSPEEGEQVMARCMEYENQYLETHPGILYPGVKEILADLSRQYSLYIVSNCQSGYIEVLIRSCGLQDYIEDMECFGNTGRPKGENIALVIKRAGLDRAVYVGDTSMDEAASIQAGIPFILAEYGFGQAQAPAAVIRSLEELPAAAERLFGEMEIRRALEPFLNESLDRIILSNPVRPETCQKSRLRPVLLKGQLVFQAEEQVGKQAFHLNLTREEAADYLVRSLRESFKQLELESGLGSGRILISKKGKAAIKLKRAAGAGKMLPASRTSGTLDHNRRKRYILEEGRPVPFLVDLGVMTKEGKIVSSRYDKYRQINRFLEFIEDILPNLTRDRELRIIDFGCGKSYLTFAMYYYLRILKGYPVRIIGLDLKEEVIDHCSLLAKEYGYEGLEFSKGDIASYEGVAQVDMVVTLHACDTATDYALEKAVKWGARVILSVPCCQHEVNGQLQNDLMEPVFHYGLIKERMAALYTDAIRGEVLEYRGYRTQILEFIDMEHTPKNILLRAVYSGKPADNGSKLKELLSFLQTEPAAVRLLAPELLP